MIVYHGTTARRAQRICVVGFIPKKPSKRVWFAESRGYALGRAKTQARRQHDRPVVLSCELDFARLRRQFGKKRVTHRGGVFSIAGALSATVVRQSPFSGVPGTAKELAAWFNRILRIKPWKGIGRNHPGVQRVADWIARRRKSQPGRDVKPLEVIELAHQWLPDYFGEIEIDPETLKSWHPVQTVHLIAESSPKWVAAHEDEALGLLDEAKPAARIRGLKRLETIGDPDLFDWCTMMLDDASIDVRLAALQTMQRCEEINIAVVEPLATDDDKRLRAAAIATLVHNAGEDALGWFDRGLKDPEPHVRLAAARELRNLNPKRHRRFFNLALADPNPQVERMATRLTAHQGYTPMKW